MANPILMPRMSDSMVEGTLRIQHGLQSSFGQQS